MGNSQSNRRHQHRHRGGHTGPLGDTQPADSLMSVSLHGSGGLMACNCDQDTAAVMQSALAQSYRPGLKWCYHDGKLWTAKLVGQPWHSQCPREIDQMAKQALSQLLQSLFRAGWRSPVVMETMRRSQLCSWLFTKQAPLPDTEVFCLAPCCSDRLLLLGRPPSDALDAVADAVRVCWPKGLRLPAAAKDSEQQQQQPTAELRLRGNPWNAYERELRDASLCLAGCAAAICDIKDVKTDGSANVSWHLAMACCVRASQPSCLFFYSTTAAPLTRSCNGGGDIKESVIGGDIKENVSGGNIKENVSDGNIKENVSGGDIKENVFGGDIKENLDCVNFRRPNEQVSNLTNKSDYYSRYRLLGFSPPDYVRIMPSDPTLLSAMYRGLTKSAPASPDRVDQLNRHSRREVDQLIQPLQQHQQHLRLGGSPWRPETPEAARTARLAAIELLNSLLLCSWLPSQPIRASGRVTEKPCLLMTSSADADEEPTINRFFCLAPLGCRSLLLAGASSDEYRIVRDTLETADALTDVEDFSPSSAGNHGNRTALVSASFQLNRRFWSTSGSRSCSGCVGCCFCCCCCCCCCGNQRDSGGGGQGTCGHWLLLALVTRLTNVAADATSDASAGAGEVGEMRRLMCASDVASRLVSRSDTVPEDWPTLWLMTSSVVDSGAC